MILISNPIQAYIARQRTIQDKRGYAYFFLSCVCSHFCLSNNLNGVIIYNLTLIRLKIIL